MSHFELVYAVRVLNRNFDLLVDAYTLGAGGNGMLGGRCVLLRLKCVLVILFRFKLELISILKNNNYSFPIFYN